MQLSKRILLPVRDRLGPTGRRYAELLRVMLGFLRAGGSVFARECNICGYKGKFYPAGFPAGLQLRLDAGCPSCGSLERHRFMKIWADQNLGDFEQKRVLHFAPERAVRRFVSPLAGEYVTADIDDHKATDVTLNIEQIDAVAEAYHCVICSHVLEHVDDRKALSELHRILKPGGVLLVMVPMIDAWDATFEDGAIDSDEQRLYRYGHCDHRRIYGADIALRLAGAGFDVQSVTANEPDVSRFGLLHGERLFICRKRAEVGSVEEPRRHVA